MLIETYREHINQAATPLVVEFWAPWCGPCRAMSPILKSTSEKYAGKVQLLKVNADESGPLLQETGVLGIPTLIAYQGGVETLRKTGAQPAEAIEALFAALAEGKVPVEGVAAVDRLLRGGAGLALGVIGIASGPSLLLLGLAGLVLFSAVYDRCPVYQAIAPRIKAFMRRERLPGGEPQGPDTVG